MRQLTSEVVTSVEVDTVGSHILLLLSMGWVQVALSAGFEVILRKVSPLTIGVDGLHVRT